MTEEETGAAMHAARMADDDFEATYELMLRVAESGDDPISLANECWNVRLSLREHIVRHYAPKPKHEIN